MDAGGQAALVGALNHYASAVSSVRFQAIGVHLLPSEIIIIWPVFQSGFNHSFLLVVPLFALEQRWMDDWRFLSGIPFGIFRGRAKQR